MLRCIWTSTIILAALQAQPALHVIDWNIDRGKHLPAVAAALRQQRPDIVLLQEVDRGTHRSGAVDEASELARLLGINVAFEPAFRELGQGGDARQGQALLARGRIGNVRVLRYRQQGRARAAGARRLP